MLSLEVYYSGFPLQKQVQQIKTWTEQVEHVQHSLTTSNGLLFVDASGIQNFIVPGLEAIFTELMDMTGTGFEPRGKTEAHLKI